MADDKLDRWTEELLASIERRRGDTACMTRLRASILKNGPVLDRLADDDYEPEWRRAGRCIHGVSTTEYECQETPEGVQHRRRQRCEAIHPATGRACTLDRGHDIGLEGAAHFDGMNTWEASPRRPGEAAQRPGERLEPGEPLTPAHCPPGALEVTRLEIARILRSSSSADRSGEVIDGHGTQAMELQGQLEWAGYRVVLDAAIEGMDDVLRQARRLEDMECWGTFPLPGYASKRIRLWAETIGKDD